MQAETMAVLSRFDDSPVLFNSALNFSAAAGITPSTETCSTADDARVFLDAVGHGGALGDPQPLVDDSVGRLAEPSATGTVRDNLTALSTPQAAGTVHHRFTPSAILDCLLLAGNLRPQASLEDTLAMAASLLFGRANSLSRDIRQRMYALPGLSLLRLSRVRLDMMNILFHKGNYSYDFDMYVISWSTPLHNSGTIFFVAERIGWLSLERSTCVLSTVRDSTSTRLSNPEIAH